MVIMKLGSKIFSNTIYMTLDWIILTFLGFIFWFVIGKTLSPEDAGMISTALNFSIVISTFAMMGMGVALVKLVSEFNKKKGATAAMSIVSMVVRPLAASLLVVTFLFLIFSPQLSSYLKMPINLFYIVIGLTISISLYMYVWNINYGFQQIRKIFFSDLVYSVSKVAVSAILIFAGFRFFGVVTALLISYLLVFLIRFKIGYLQKLKQVISYKKLLAYSVPMLIAAVSTSFIGSSQYIILTLFQNPEVTGYFTVAFTISSLLFTIPVVINGGLFPVMSELSTEKGNKKIKGRLVGLVIRYALLAIAPLTVLILSFSKQFVLLFSQARYLPAEVFFPILVPSTILMGFAHVFYTNIYAIGKPSINRNISITVSVLFLILSIPLTIILGGVGLTLALLVVNFVNFSLSYFFLRRFMKIKFFLGDTAKILLATVLVSTLAYYFSPLLTNLLSFVLTSLFIILVYAVILKVERFFRYEDIRLIEYLAKHVPLLKKPLNFFKALFF